VFTSQGSRPGPKSFGPVGRLRETFRWNVSTFAARLEVLNLGE